MSRIPLEGLTVDPLLTYLAALGLHRAVALQIDPAATLEVHADHFVLTSTFDGLEPLVEWMTDQWRPTPVVSPWNKGSGLRPHGSAKSAKAALARLDQSHDPRLADLRVAVTVARQVIAGFPEDTTFESEKEEILLRCRAELPDAALPWLDAAVLTRKDEPAYPILLGSGGNFGRQDLAANLYEHLDKVIGLAEPCDAGQSRSWLTDLLAGTNSQQVPKAKPGQFDPGRAGGVNTSIKGDQEGYVNPWGFVLAIEGALLFAARAVRRLGANRGAAAAPFTVNSDAVGGGAAARGESFKGELWLPVWHAPATHRQLSRLFGEGRIAWGRSPARTTLDAARAVRTLGAERGIDAFAHYLLVERLGQSPLAVYVSTHRTADTTDHAAIATRVLDAWVGSKRRGSNLPARQVTAVRAVDRALFELATNTTSHDSARMFLLAIADLELTLGRNARLRSEHAPAPRLRAADWQDLLDDQTPEFELAVGIVSGRHPIHLEREWVTSNGHPASTGHWPVRVATAIRGVVPTPRGFSWAHTGARPLDGPSELMTFLATLHRSHAARIGRTHPEPHLNGPAGARTAHPHRLFVASSTIHAFVAGELDLRRVTEHCRTLSLLDRLGPVSSQRSGEPTPPVTTAGLAMQWLLPFDGTTHYNITSERGATEPRAAGPLLLLPGQDWPSLLSAGHLDRVLADASRRRRAGGLPAGHPPLVPKDVALGRRLAAGLLVRPHPGDAAKALQHTCPGLHVRSDPSSSQPEPPVGDDADPVPTQETLNATT